MNEVTTAQMKELERLADAAGLPYPRMMENAGAAAARELMARVPGLKAAAVFCGRGNNGGDGLVAARRLQDAGGRPDAAGRGFHRPGGRAGGRSIRHGLSRRSAPGGTARGRNAEQRPLCAGAGRSKRRVCGHRRNSRRRGARACHRCFPRAQTLPPAGSGAMRHGRHRRYRHWCSVGRGIRSAAFL